MATAFVDEANMIPPVGSFLMATERVDLTRENDLTYYKLSALGGQ
jgi:hypothetical protein